MDNGIIKKARVNKLIWELGMTGRGQISVLKKVIIWRVKIAEDGHTDTWITCFRSLHMPLSTLCCYALSKMNA